jgi:hypothetical protein
MAKEIHRPLVFVADPGSGIVHYAYSEEIAPLCTCLCPSPGKRRKAGDTLCKCPCHGKGPAHALALCGRSPARARWTVVGQRVDGSRAACQACAHAAIYPPPPPPAVCGACNPWVRASPPVVCTIALERGTHEGLHRGTFQGKIVLW